MSESITIPPKQFTNWYEVLGIPPAATAEEVTRVYQQLSTKLRPENKATGDARRFQEVKSAYDVLSSTERRRAFDQELRLRPTGSGPIFQSKEFADDVDAEINRRLGILCLLYNQRKIDPVYPGLSVAQLETLMSTPREDLEFSFWYLKQKRLVLADDRSTMTILCEGIDFIEENLPRSGQRLLQPHRGGDVDRAA